MLIDLVSSSFPPLCILFQLFRLGSLVMFSIFQADCMLYQGSSTVDCTNFTVYNTPKCDAYCWKTLWLICSILTSTVYICLLNRTVLPELRPVGNKIILKCLLRKPYFWSLNTTTALVVLYDVLIMIQNEKAKIGIECLVRGEMNTFFCEAESKRNNLRSMYELIRTFSIRDFKFFEGQFLLEFLPKRTRRTPIFKYYKLF